MKKILLFTLMCFVTYQLSSQVSYGGQPYTSLNNKMTWVNSLEKMPAFDVEAMKAEDDINNVNKDVPFRFGKKFILGKNLENSGEWNVLPNGDRVWLLTLESTGAMSLNLGWDIYDLPEGAYMYVYNENKTEVIGRFDHRNNNDEETFSTWPIFGDKITVELYEPLNVMNQSKLQIEYLTHAYRDLNDIAKGIGDSGGCNNDVICPVSAGWEDQINSVAMIVVGGNGICTGALVNNTANDQHPYFLTANHCTGGGVSTWTFRFNFQATTCGGSTSQAFNTVSGSTLLASGGSADYCLLEINNGNPIPTSYNPYYAGWDASGAVPTSSVGVHHPSGDLKKISFDNQAAGTNNFGGAVCWQVFDWEDGTTEPGSSGSPLFDQNKRIVGQLYGGQASCSFNVNDYYGKFDVTYPNVCAWLSPGCSTTVLDGLDPNATANLDNDAGIQSISEPSGTSCSTTTTPEVVLRNYGINTLTSVTIDYGNVGGTSLTFAWTGSLASGASETVSLPAFIDPPGTYTFLASTSDPNGVTDEDATNDAATASNVIVEGIGVTLEIDTDCWGNETSWILQDATGTIIDQINSGTLSNQTNYIWNFCLVDGCYDLIVNDTFGDGLNGTAFGCAVNGNYTVTDDSGNVLVSMGVADFGFSVTENFCVSGGDEGCTDPVACNYNPGATIDNGSCTFPGCTDAAACNYDSTAGCDDGSCLIAGCTNSAACNFDSLAFCDDGTCVFGPTNDLCSGALPLNEGANLIDNSLACITEGYTVPGGGCNTTTTWCNLNGIEADVFYSFTTPATPTVVTLETSFDGSGTLIDTQMAVFDDCNGALIGANDDGAADLYMSLLSFDCGVLLPNTTYIVLIDGYNGNVGTATLNLTFDNSTCLISGCTNPIACNFNADADLDDGSCILPDGCTDATACNYDATALCDDGSCEFTSCAGCTDNTACNFDSTATIDDGSCILPDGCTDATACNYDATALCDDGSCEFTSCAGCTDNTACNFDSTATIDDGSCILPDGCTDATACNYDATALCDDGSCEFTSCAGCTDNTACNFDSTATIDDGSCILPDGCTDATACNYDATALCDDGSCEFTSCAGCTDNTACNFDSTATIDDGSCILPDGCTDATACNYDATALCDDGSCEFTSCAGCTDNTACNFDSTATIDNGSCILPDGCTDATACNYDATALCDDGSCTFAPCGTCVGDANADGFVNILDLVSVSSNIGCTFGCEGNGDANFDSVVDILDLIAVSSNFGSICD